MNARFMSVAMLLLAGGLVGCASGPTYAEVAKKTGTHSSMSIGFGRKYVGQTSRVAISMNSSFTLGELWRAVSGEAGDALTGATALEVYNQEIDDFFKEGEDDIRVNELSSVFRRDIGSKLITQDIGLLSKDPPQHPTGLA